MPAVNITRTNAPSVARREVAAGAVFATRDRQGRLGTNYAAIGHNGRWYSVNLATSALASSSNGDKQVVLTGKFKYNITREAAVVRRCRRSEVRSGEVFIGSGGSNELYAHVGTVDKARNGFLSLHLNGPMNHAIAENANAMVDVVGSYTLDVTLTR